MAERPLSPHLGVYRWAYSMTLSILHRVTGIALSLCLIGFVAWLVSASAGPGRYDHFLPWVTSPPARLLIALAAIALIYHCCNGLRHLAWDIGFGFERSQSRTTAVAVIVVTAVAALLVLYGLFVRGGAA